VGALFVIAFERPRILYSNGMEDLVLPKLNLNVFESNFAMFPTPPLTPLAFRAAEGSYFPDAS
jgi:hypothetical protein